MSDLVVLRERIDVAERVFAVYGEPWFDPSAEEWCARLLFLPLDRSFPRAVSSGTVRRAARRESLLASMRRLGDQELRRTLATVALAGTATE